MAIPADGVMSRAREVCRQLELLELQLASARRGDLARRIGLANREVRRVEQALGKEPLSTPAPAGKHA
ncbi:MAG: hypothetical protein ACE5R4_09555 [Armatimonadota bacterium]